VFLEWDQARREFVRKVRALGVPMLVLLVVEPGYKTSVPVTDPDRPERFYVLECGKIEEGLAQVR
jgi:hypothetical protein